VGQDTQAWGRDGGAADLASAEMGETPGGRSGCRQFPSGKTKKKKTRCPPSGEEKMARKIRDILVAFPEFNLR